MKHLILAAATALAIATAPANISAAQPDHAAIAAQAKTSSYTDLLKKFKEGKQLTEAEATTLYYGSALQPGFTPDKDYTPVIAAYNSGDMKRAYNLANEALASDPTNLALLFKAYAAASASSDPNIKAQAPALQTRLLAICDAIMNSGSGVADASPYQVIRRSDINEFLVKYMQPKNVVGQSQIGQLTAIKASFDGIPDDVILYFGIFK